MLGLEALICSFCLITFAEAEEFLIPSVSEAVEESPAKEIPASMTVLALTEAGWAEDSDGILRLSADAAQTDSQEDAPADAEGALSAAATPDEQFGVYYQPIEDDDDAVTFTFAGDLLMDPYYAAGVQVHVLGLAGCFDEAALSIMRDSDIFMLNNEFPFTDSNVPQQNKMFTFHAPTSSASMLFDIGTDIVSLGNNHIYDYNAVGVTDTLDTLDAIGMPHVGAGRNISEATAPYYYKIPKKDGGYFTVGIINATQIERYDSPNTLPATETSPGVFRCYDPTLMYQVITEAKTKADFVIVYIHWGNEKETQPVWPQIEQAQEMERLGVDLIIGDHPHVLQPIEYIGDMPVVYSLGNYLFTSFTLDTGVVRITLSPSEERMSSLQFIPMLQSGTRVHTSEGSEKERILQEMRSMSSTAQFDADGYVTPK